MVQRYSQGLPKVNTLLDLNNTLTFMPSEGEQLKNYIDNQPKSKISIARALGMSKQNLFDLFKSQVLRQETKSRFEDYFGEKIFDQTAEKPLSFIEQRRHKKQQSRDPFLVPLVPVKAQAGYVKAIDQEVFMDTLEKYALPPGVNPHGAVWRYWEVEGESMEPAFHSGDIILTSQVHQMDWENLRNFYLYVIVTKDRVLFKRLFCKNLLEWVLISENEEHSPQQLLRAEDVKEVWVFRRHIVNKAPPSKVFEIKV